VLHRTTIAALAALLVVAACGSDDDASTSSSTSTSAPVEETTTSTATVEPLTVLVTNDDGIGAPGIDAMVTALAELDDVEVVIVAPAENQSGSSDKTTPEGVEHAPGETASGVEGTAVQGFPADTIAVALDELGVEPDLVVSGVNEGQNHGPFAYISGTVGAGRAAVRRGVPAVAGSAGLGDLADFDAAAALVVDWIEANRSALGAAEGTPDGVVSFNVPGCTAGDIRELLEVPLGSAFPEGDDPFTSDCSLEPAGDPVDDVSAIEAGHATQTLVPTEAPAG
jgi:5'-nucleotidase